jgi:hypothetical protein
MGALRSQSTSQRSTSRTEGNGGARLGKGVWEMSYTALFLSRLQFAFTVSFHIIFPSFTIGLAAWLALWRR